jgi:hypothetical protein
MINPKQNPLAGARLVCLYGGAGTQPFKEAAKIVPLSANGALVDSPPVTLSAQSKPKAARQTTWTNKNGVKIVDLAAIFDSEAGHDG